MIRKYQSIDNTKRNTFWGILERRSDDFLTYMRKTLRFSNFKQILINKEKKIGYYSFKKRGEEICLEYDENKGWLVCLCNKWEEVLDENIFATKQEAIRHSNEFYQCFGKLDIFYK